VHGDGRGKRERLADEAGGEPSPEACVASSSPVRTGRSLPAARHAAVGRWHVGRVCPRARVAAGERQRAVRQGNRFRAHPGGAAAGTRRS
jgi:hypothetical protein